MIVVADASPLNYLIQVRADRLLHTIFGQVLAPAAVMQELSHPRAPAEVAKWMSQLPAWIEVRDVTLAPDDSLRLLDYGEREAILLALEARADLLLIDERRGRSEARRRGITTTGTLGVLIEAGRRGFADPEPLFRRLITETSFRSTPELQEMFLQQCSRINRERY